MQLVHSFAQVRSDLTNLGTKGIETARFDLVIRALCDDEAGLKIIRPINQDQRLSVIHVAQYLCRIIRLAADSEPQDIDRHSMLDDFQSGRAPDKGMPAIAAHDQIRSDL